MRQRDSSPEIGRQAQGGYLSGVTNGQRAELVARLLYLAWRWYRIPRDAAEDIAQSAILTYLQIADRYPATDEHPVILVGIFRNKCREHIAGSVRSQRQLRALRTAAESGKAEVAVVPSGTTDEDGVLSDLVQGEDGRLILEALAALQPKAREMFRLIIEEDYSRQELIEHYGINKNTLDSRLHAYRNQLREILADRGVQI